MAGYEKNNFCIYCKTIKPGWFNSEKWSCNCCGSLHDDKVLATIEKNINQQLKQQLELLEEALCTIAASHHADTCSKMLSKAYDCDCHKKTALNALNKLNQIGEK